MAQQEAAAARGEAASLRLALTGAQQEAAAARGEAVSLRLAVTGAQQEAAATRGEAASLRLALTGAQQEAAAARGEAASLRLAVAAAQQEASAAFDEIGRLGAVAQARDDAEAWKTALLASTSWKITAPLRAVSGLFSANPMRHRRLGLVWGVGHRSGGAKGPARIAVYGLGRAVARVPGGRMLARMVSLALPGPYRWLYARYFTYRSIVVPSEILPADPGGMTPPAGSGRTEGEQAVSMTGNVVAPSETLPADPQITTAANELACSEIAQAEPQAAMSVPSGLAAEEQAMLLRLRSCDEAA
jgi:hypothetical protein